MTEKAIQIVWISNIIFEPYTGMYKECFLPTKYNVQLNCVIYEEINRNTDVLKNADIVVICLNFDELYSNLMIESPEADYMIDQICKDKYLWNAIQKN